MKTFVTPFTELEVVTIRYCPDTEIRQHRRELQAYLETCGEEWEKVWEKVCGKECGKEKPRIEFRDCVGGPTYCKKCENITAYDVEGQHGILF